MNVSDVYVVQKRNICMNAVNVSVQYICIHSTWVRLCISTIPFTKKKSNLVTGIEEVLAPAPKRGKKAANNRKFLFRAVHDLIRSTNSIVPYIFFPVLMWLSEKKKLLFSFHWRFNGQFVRYLYFYMYDFIEIDIY